MGIFRRWLLIGTIALFFGGAVFQAAGSRIVLAENNAAQDTETATPGPYKRVATVIVTYTKYIWWMLRWSNNKGVCTLVVEHDGLPKLGEVESQCDPDVFEEWQNTKPCDTAEGTSTDQCPGFYLQFVSSRDAERQVKIELPLPAVWISIENCNPEPPDMRCTTLPNLVFTGEEPLPNESVISLQGKIAGVPFYCSGSTCSQPLQPTGMDGIDVEFWAISSFGDSSQHFTAKVRLVPWGGFMNPEGKSKEPVRYYADVISTQWRGAPIASCSDTWQSFPDIGGPPEWLTSPTNPDDLKSNFPYYYLAGALITYGIVDASACLDGGLQAPNIASPCGVEAAKPQLADWQNRFDSEIIKTSQETGLPARLLKNVFSRESQIWPGIFRTYLETGLGQMTENGADTVLLWNPDFFHVFCPFVLHKSYCDLGYGNLDNDYPLLSEMLRGALVRKVDASCPDCPFSIDLKEANYSVHVFGESLLANCEQVGRMVTNLTGLDAGREATYEDLWRFTLVNYNAGPGCLSTALDQAFQSNQLFTWQNISANLDPACQGSIGYVEDISGELKITPTPTVWLPFNNQPPTPVMPRVLVTPTPSGTAPIEQNTPLPSPTRAGTQTPTASPTTGASPTAGPSPTASSTSEDYPPKPTDTPVTPYP